MLLFLNGSVIEIRPQQTFETNEYVDSKYVEELLEEEKPKKKKLNE